MPLSLPASQLPEFAAPQFSLEPIEPAARPTSPSALFPTNGAAPPPAEACWKEGSEGEGEGSEGEGSEGQGQGSEDEEAEVCSPTPSTTPSPLSIYLHSHRAILTLALHLQL